MKSKRIVCTALALAMASSAVYVPAAQAALVGTEQAVKAARSDASVAAARQRLATLLQRDDVAGKLSQYGVDTAQARERVAALSDDEVLQLTNRIDSLPAGGTDVLGIALVVFIVLLITDIAGYTDIFPFVNHGSGRR